MLGELAAARGDGDDEVRSTAEALLGGTLGEVPLLARYEDEGKARKACDDLRARADDVLRWAGRIGRELLGRPVEARQTRKGIGFTMGSRKGPIVVHVSDEPVTSGHRHGTEIMRGIVLHELGHHLYDIGITGYKATRGIARASGIGEIYDILLDERLERGLRSRRAEWGPCFDRLASYAFAQSVSEVPLDRYAALAGMSEEALVERIERGDMPGRPLPPKESGGPTLVALGAHDTLRIPGLVPLLSGFLFCLRCGFRPEAHPDRRVRLAIDEVPSNLKELNHAEILEVTRRVAAHIGSSNKHRRDMARLQKKMRRFRQVLRGLDRAMRRMRATGALPEGFGAGEPGEGDEGGTRGDIMARKYLERTGHLKRPHELRRGGGRINRDPGTEFGLLSKEKTFPYDAEAHRKLVTPIRENIRRLRPYLERLGTRMVEEHASRRGRRIDIACARKSAVLPTPNMLIHAREEILPNAYIGVLIDRSGSMVGPKMETARAFGALVAESARGIRGLDGHVNAFDDTTFFPLGPFERNSIASLEAGAGNNDAGGLWRAAELALRSGRKNKLLIMISDGQPTECTFESLQNLVVTLTRRHGILCAQVAVDKLDAVAFPHFVDLSKYPMNEAVARFGKLLVRLTSAWR